MNYFEDDVFKNLPEFGLYLIDHNTGTGKTRETVKGMVRFCLDESFKRRQVFCSQQWKNIPIDDLENEFKAQHASKEFERRVLVIRPLLENIRDMLQDNEASIPTALHDSQEFRLLKQQLQATRSLKGDNEAGALQDRIRQDLNQCIGAFRNRVTSHLIELYPSLEKRREAVSPNGKAAWVSALFPSSRCTDPEVRIMLLTTSMLLLPTSLVIERGSIVFAHDVIDGAILYLDEFDGSKRILLDRILSQATRHDFDLIRACANIAKWLPSQKLNSSLLTETDERKSSIDAKRSKRGVKPIKHISGEYEDTIALFKSLMKNWRLDRNFKLDPSAKGISMLFQESHHDHIVGLWNGSIEFLDDDVNLIRSIPTSDSNTTLKLTSLIKDCTSALLQFAWFCKHLADNETSKSTDRHGIEFNILFRLKFRSILEHFNLDPPEIEWITDIIDNQRLSPAHGSEHEPNGNPLHDHGFRLTALVDGDDHEYQTMIRQYGVPMTPERVLLAMAQKAFIVGLSATSTIPSVMCNYDLEYFRNVLGKHFHEPSAQDIDNKNKEYSKLTLGYTHPVSVDKKHSTDVIWIEHSSTKNDDQKMEQWTKLLHGNQATVHLLLNSIEVEATSINDTPDFIIDRYYRLLQVLERFAKEPGCQAHLAFFQKLAKPGDAAFNQDIICKMATILGYQILHDGQVNQNDFMFTKGTPVLTFLTTRQLHAGAPEILQALKRGVRILAVTSYGTSGIGINLQYEADDPDTIYIHDMHGRDKSDKLDWNGIYLDMPTNIVPTLKAIGPHDERMKALLSRLLAILYIEESGSMPWSDSRRLIEDSLAQFEGNPAFKSRGIRVTETYPVLLAMNAIVIQALGRLERTARKKPALYVFIDSDLRKALTEVSLPPDMIPLHSWKTIHDDAERLKHEKESQALKGAKGERWEQQASYAMDRIDNVLHAARVNGGWSDKDMRFWTDLRECCLRQPTALSANKRSKDHTIFFFNTSQIDSRNRSSYWYKQEADYHEFSICFDQKPPSRDFTEVSSDNADLHNLMGIPEIAAGFIRRGFATSWEPGKSLMTPAVFNNIYKGALGEAVLSIVLEDILGETLLPFDWRSFEAFDLAINGSVFLDSKYWRNQKASDDIEEYQRYCLDKLDRVDGQHVILVRTSIVPDHVPLLSKDSIDPARISIMPRLLVQTGDGPRIDPKACKILANTIRNHR